MNRGVEFIGFSLAPADDLIHVVQRSRHFSGVRRSRKIIDPPGETFCW